MKTLKTYEEIFEKKSEQTRICICKTDRTELPELPENLRNLSC